MIRVLLSVAALFVFIKSSEAGDSYFSKEKYVFDGLLIAETNVVQVELINDTGHRIDDIEVMSSCGCLSVVKDTVPSFIEANDSKMVSFEVQSPHGTEVSKTNTVYVSYEGELSKAEIVTSFVLSEGFYPADNVFFYCGVLGADSVQRSATRTITYKARDGIDKEKIPLKLVNHVDELEVIISPLGLSSLGLYQWNIEVKPKTDKINGEFDINLVFEVGEESGKRITCRAFGRKEKGVVP